MSSRYEIAFPQEVPVNAFADLFGWVTSGTLGDHKPEAILAGVNVVAYGGKVVADAVGGPAVIGESSFATEEEEAFRLVGQQAQASANATEGVTVMGGISPALIAKAVMYVIRNILPLLIK